MNVFIKGVPVNATDKEVTKFLRQPLKECGIDFYQLDKSRAKDIAFLTVPTVEDGQRFLRRYGASSVSRLRWHNQNILFRIADRAPSDFAVRALAYEGAKAPKPSKTSSKDHTNHDITNLRCGTWAYTNHPEGRATQLAFVSHYLDPRNGTIHLGRRAAIVILGDPSSDQVRMDINYRDCASITVGSSRDPSVSFELYFPPKLYKVGAAALTLESSMQRLGLEPSTQFKKYEKYEEKKERLSSLIPAHARTVGSCFVYRLKLADARRLSTVLSQLKHNATGCSVHAITIPKFSLNEPYQDSVDKLKHQLTDTGHFGNLPFGLLYQVERLAQNGLLPPTTVRKMLLPIKQLYTQHGLNATISAIRQFYREIPLPGPETEALQVSDYVKLLGDFASSYDPDAPESVYELSKRHTHINLVHRIVVTPTRIRLEGPEPEPTNRVLRRHRKDADYFLRVVFQEEDGGTFRYDPAASQKAIYARFKEVLKGSINVAGRGFSFLGFSHSSLRNQACWFMAPFVIDGLLCLAPQIVRQLGDFSHFRCPAKCAARIGQNFTDTNATVDVSPRNVGELAVVQRNGRDFSDGVGTISYDLLQRVWRVYGSKRFIRPTALQIRFQGAKGMVSLDTRLHGEQLMLRSNMRKFHTSTTWNLEICGAAFQPLPMILNRQFIKIFEDLGIPLATFRKLQDAAVGRLRRMTATAPDAASLLDDARSTSRIPSLIRLLHELGINFHGDDFISVIIEAIILSKLRDIKYRGRIPVEKGCTLYGIMDETGYLQEGQIYVVTEHADLGKQVIVGENVVVTRSPALHPGDIQIARTVDVPSSSPLSALSNVVVFSQHGSRDLPSMLSGGDLDGDLYNIIWDPDLIPTVTYQAADYPRVAAIELDREVRPDDMSNFFVDFMETDQLGYISNLHLQISDQEPLGTLSPSCIKLAGMASTAVDFSKTGIPVDMKQLPRYDRCRPDFMAPSPRVFVSESGFLDLEDDDREPDDAFEGLDAERRPQRYYESNKVLGHLYRDIDEREFLNIMHRARDSVHNEQPVGDRDRRQPLQRLHRYLQHWAMQYGLIWKHHLALARDIKETFEASVADIAYDFEPSAHNPLTEAEIFSGTILGRQGGAQGKTLRELDKNMCLRFETVMEYTVMRIMKGDQQIQQADDLDDLYDQYSEREIEALPRALACLQVAMEEPGYRDRAVGELKGFRYVAAEVALSELRRYQITTLGTYSLPLA